MSFTRYYKYNIREISAQNYVLGLPDFLSLTVGLLSAVYVDVGGNLYWAEILLLLLLPYLFYTRARLLRFSILKLLLVLGVGWLLNQIVTDLYRGTIIEDVVKGWALITIFLTNFLSLYLLIFPSPRRIALGLFGHAIGLILRLVLQPSNSMLVDAWKFGIGYGVMLLVSIIPFFLRKKRSLGITAWVLILALVALYSFYVRSRALGGVAILSSFVVWFRFIRIGRWVAQRADNLIAITTGILLLLGASWGIIQGYGYFVEKGYFGEGARFLYRLQSSGDYGILLGGRQAWLPAMHALIDSPFIGYGSYARNTEYGQYLYELANLGYIVNGDQLDKYLAARNFIPTHSHLLQGWIWAGLAGGVFWCLIFMFIIYSLILAYRYTSEIFMSTFVLGFFGMWSVLFSPLSNSLRLQWAFILVALFYALIYQPPEFATNDHFSQRP